MKYYIATKQGHYVIQPGSKLEDLDNMLEVIINTSSLNQKINEPNSLYEKNTGQTKKFISSLHHELSDSNSEVQW